MKIKNRAIGLLTTMAVVLVLGSGVALAASAINCTANTICVGTSMADTMSGSALMDYMFGKGGADTMHGHGGSDSMQGDNGSDHIYGGIGSDSSLWGGALSGSSYTDNSNDYVYGGRGNDNISGGLAQGGVDRLYGGGGNDFIVASQKYQEDFKPVTKEIIDCGAGAQDEVYFDKGLDVVKNCEMKHAIS